MLDIDEYISALRLLALLDRNPKALCERLLATTQQLFGRGSEVTRTPKSFPQVGRLRTASFTEQSFRGLFFLHLERCKFDTV